MSTLLSDVNVQELVDIIEEKAGELSETVTWGNHQVDMVDLDEFVTWLRDIRNDFCLHCDMIRHNCLCSHDDE